MRGCASWFPARWLTILFMLRRWSCCAFRPRVAEARRTLQSYADASRAMLAELPARPARDALEALTDVVVARTS